jgi:hypothetical protein
MKKFIIFLIINTHLISSAIVIDTSKSIIQIGAFKKITNINKLKKAFDNYQIVVKKTNNNLNKIFIVNIERKEIKSTLKNIKSIVPNAFLLSLKQKQMIFHKKNTNILQNKTFTKINNSKKLDSKAIIKTRKKFFE